MSLCNGISVYAHEYRSAKEKKKIESMIIYKMSLLYNYCNETGSSSSK